MELKRIHQAFSVCQVEDYSLVNFESQYCFIGKTDEEKSFVCATCPFPVLHAIKSSGDEISDVTIPTSRALTKHKEQEVVEELNIHKKVKELTEKIVEMKRQRRGVDKVIQKSEAELGKIFDRAGIDCLEMDTGKR